MDCQLIAAAIEQKNQWLYHQVEVEFPTKESIAGRDFYLAAQQLPSAWQPKELILNSYEQDNSCEQETAHNPWIDEVVLVDFHRLTILFSVFQAKQWQNNPEQQALIIEFLTQIILDDNYQLYLGFKQQNVVAALICQPHQEQSTAILSDIYLEPPLAGDVSQACAQFIAMVGFELAKQLPIERLLWTDTQ